MKVRIILFLTLLASAALGQKPEIINQIDARGLKQGHWIKKDGQGHKIYDGYFKDGKPSGRLKRFYDNDSIQSVMDFNTDGKSVDVVFYTLNGFPASKGKYSDKMKTGKWQFFSPSVKNLLVAEEQYDRNLRNGLSVKFYPDSTIAEKVYYSNDIKQGDWTKYYPDGKISLAGHYTNGLLDGAITIYYDNGSVQFKGQYKKDLREGEWIKYSSNGGILSRVTYESGKVTDPEVFKKESQYLDSLERNRGKLADPEKTGTLWQ